MDDVSMPRDGTVDKLLYDNFAEMIRLIPAESLPQGQQTTKAFSFKKGVEDSALKKSGLGQLILSQKGIVDMILNDKDGYEEEIPLLPIPSNHRGNGAGVPTVEILQLHSKVQQLEQKLNEKECQLQDANKSFQQMHLQLNATTERFESQIQEKELAIKEIQNQLFRKQLEVINLQSLVKKLELDIKTANLKEADSL